MAVITAKAGSEQQVQQALTAAGDHLAIPHGTVLHPEAGGLALSPASVSDLCPRGDLNPHALLGH